MKITLPFSQMYKCSVTCGLTALGTLVVCEFVLLLGTDGVVVGALLLELLGNFEMGVGEMVLLVVDLELGLVESCEVKGGFDLVVVLVDAVLITVVLLVLGEVVVVEGMIVLLVVELVLLLVKLVLLLIGLVLLVVELVLLVVELVLLVGECLMLVDGRVLLLGEVVVLLGVEVVVVVFVVFVVATLTSNSPIRTVPAPLCRANTYFSTSHSHTPASSRSAARTVRPHSMLL